MLFTWPENILPLPSDNFSADPTFGNLRTRMDSGRARVRPRTTEPETVLPVVFQLDKIQYAFFVAIWRMKLNNGTDWFTMRIPQPNNKSLTLTQVRFIGDYSPQHQQHENWNVTVTLEQFEENVMSLDELDAAIKYGLDYEKKLAADIVGIDTVFPKDFEQNF